MAMANEPAPHDVDESLPEIARILDDMLENNIEISARELARRHPTIRSASSFTRMPQRRLLLQSYKQNQKRIQKVAANSGKQSRQFLVQQIADKDVKIAALENQVTMLLASHVAMLRAVGELGGVAAWSKFFDRTQAVREKLRDMGALPNANVVTLVPEDR